MNFFAFIKAAEKKAKLFLLYWRRIVFAPGHFDVSPLKKLTANLSGGFTADQWALYDLDRKKRKEYLSEFDWYRSRYINEPFDYMLNNKVVATEVLRQYIRVPEMYMVKSHGAMMDFGGNILTQEQVLAILREHGHIIIKPFDKGKGTGVHTIAFEDGEYFVDEQRADEDAVRALIERQGNCYFSEIIGQHAYADILYDKTVNTIRIITLRDPETRRFKVFFAVQRIGRRSTIPVDNGSQGGLICKIDLETGRLSHGRCLHDKVVYASHPDSGTRFEDVSVPSWDELKEEILSLSEKFPYLHFIAWDVVKMKDGTNCIIEANTSSGVNIIQLWGSQRNGELGDFYRHHKVIR